MGKWDVNWGQIETVPYQYGTYYAGTVKEFETRRSAEKQKEQTEYNRRARRNYEKATAQTPGYGIMTPEAREAIPRNSQSSKTSTEQKTSSGTQSKAQSTATGRTTRQSSGNVSKQSPVSTTQQPVTPQPNITGGYTYTPTASGTKVSRGGWSFEVPAQSQISQDDWDTYINQPIVDNNTNTTNYDTNYIRGFRGQGEQGYRDVNSYLTWLGNNKDSADYKLFMQNGYFNDSGDLDYGQIGAMLASQGIRGNLGRRDSGRLGNVLTRLRNQSTEGTPENKQFLQGVVSSYNQNKGKWGLTSSAELGEDGKIRLLNNSSSPSSFATSVTNFFNKYPNIESVKSQFSNSLPAISYDFWRNPGGVLSTIYQNIPLWKKNNN